MAVAEAPPAEPGQISDGDYMQVQQTLCMMAGLLRDLPLQEFIARIDRAESFGCFIAPPQMYSRALPRLDKLKDMASAAIRLAAAGDGLAEIVRKDGDT